MRVFVYVIRACDYLYMNDYVRACDYLYTND